MKKLFTFIIALIACVSTLFAESGTCGDNLTWDLADGVLSISGTGYMTNFYLDAPWMYSSFSSAIIDNNVTSIGDFAFAICSNLTSVTIGNSVTRIGSGAFAFCPILTSIVVSNENTIYDSRENCNAIIETSSNKLVQGCQNTILPNSITSIGESAFFWCSGLTKIFISNNITSIERNALAYCPDLTEINVATDNPNYSSVDSVLFNKNLSMLVQYPGGKPDAYTIPNSVTSIGDGAFWGCSGLTSIKIPNSVTNIGDNAFESCTALTSITCAAAIPPACGSDAFYDVNKTTPLYVPASSIAAYQVAEEWKDFTSIQAIDETPEDDIVAYGICGEQGNNLTWALSYDNILTISGTGNMANYSNDCPWKELPFYSVIIENGVTSIGIRAFKGCSGLTSIKIPSSVTSIGNQAFVYCTNLTSIEIPSSVTDIGDAAFWGCSGLTSIEIPITVTSIGKTPFYGCTALTSVIWNAKSCALPYNSDSPFFNSRGQITSFVFGDKVETIPASLCYEMDKLTSITIPNSVTSIGNNAFTYCSGIKSLTIGNSVTSIGDGAFHNCSGLTSIVVENGNTEYDSRENCNALIETSSNTLILGCQNTIIPNGVTIIGVLAFSSCKGLTSIEIPNNVTSIGASAFSNCENLTSITIPNSVTSIENNAFSYCTSLTSIEIPKSVTYLGGNVFFICTGLTSIVVESGNTNYDSRDNCNAIIETSSNTLIQGCQNTIIPNGVTNIGDRAFCGCSGLTSIEIPKSVTNFGFEAFAYCDNLTSVTIGNSVTSIGEAAFSGCIGLTSVTIPKTQPPIPNPQSIRNIHLKS